MSRADGPAEGCDAEVPVDGPETIGEQRLLASLGRRARQVNHDRVLRLLTLLDDDDAGALDEDGRREAENLAHQVVGSAGTFGYPTASVDASAVEDHFAGRGRRTGSEARGADPGAAAVRGTLEGLRTLFAG